MKSLRWYQEKVYTFFKNDFSDNYEITEGQSNIFRIVYEPSILRGVIRAVTQYGKSDVTSMGIVSNAIDRKERILVVAPSGNQAGIIMRYAIGHMFDNPFITQMLEIDTSLERLKKERSKNRITFKNDSEIYILTADVNTVSKEAKSLMGFGASVVIEDESALIPDIMHSKILRMVGGQVYEGDDRGKLIQLGNPFPSGHFQRAFNSPKYEKVIIRKEQAIAEGRLTQEFLDEAKQDMTPMDFTIFYDCEFPPEGAENSLIAHNLIDQAVDNPIAIGGERQAGLDVARFGRDKTVYVLREGSIVKRIEIMEHADTMKVVGWVRGLLKEDGNPPLNIDVIGIGSGVYDRLEELEEYDVIPINVGEGGTDDEAKKKFHNLRAQMFWNLMKEFQLIDGKSMIRIPNDVDLIKQLKELRYSYSSERRIKIESKDDLKKRLGYSPDKADALALAFFRYEINEPEMVIL